MRINRIMAAACAAHVMTVVTALPVLAGLFGTAFTYQGSLTDGGGPADGTYDLHFLLYAAANAPLPIASFGPLQDVEVVEGLFTVELDFGSQFTGEERWLGIGVRPGNSTGGYTALSPLQRLSATPHAVIANRFVLPFIGTGNTSAGELFTTHLFDLTQSGSAAAIHGAATGTGTGVMGEALASAAIGVVGKHNATTGFVSAVYGESSSTSGRGVYGHNLSSSGSAAYGVQGITQSSTSGASGVRGVANGGGSALTYGVRGESNSTGGAGVVGIGGKYGVYGLSNEGGVDSAGVLAISAEVDGTGITGRCSAGGSVSTGIFGQATGGGWAGFFEGGVYVTGTLSGPDKAFLIDNPANPEHEYLQHSVVESDERRNIYDGVVAPNTDGSATVTLPDWFDSLNGSFRYQLTCIGGHAPVYVASEIQDNQFTIAGGRAGLKVSWQVTGVRIDPYAAAHPFQAVRPKAAADRGKYLDAAAHGRSAEHQIKRMHNPWPVTAPATEGADVPLAGDAASE